MADKQSEEKPSSSTSAPPRNQDKPKKRKLTSDAPTARAREWTRLTGAPAWDLPPSDANAQQFTGRCRLFVANLPQSATEESLRALFAEFGQIADIYIGKLNQFAFVKMDTRQNAESARNALDGRPLDGRTLRVRLAAHAAAVRVTNLPPLASNELLALAFSCFGHVERAVVSADDRGRSLGEGIVEFARKSSALAALKKCHNECLLLSATPVPVHVAPLEARDEEEGVPEKTVVHAPEYRQEREAGPRFAEAGAPEWEMALKWKQLAEIESQRREQLEQEFRDLRSSLRREMEALKVEATTRQLREQLRQMESESQKLSREREQRLLEERRREEQRRQTEQQLRQQEAELLRGRQHQGEDISALRRQENELRQQANALQQLLDRQEAALRQMAPEALQPQHVADMQSHVTQFAPMQPQNNFQSYQMRAQQPLAPPPIPGNAHQQFGRGQQPMGGQQGHAHHYKRNRRF